MKKVHRPVRQRQDAPHTTPQERLISDASAKDLYEQLWLGALRSGTNINAPERVVEVPGYCAPEFDPKRGAQVAAEARQVLDETFRHRMELLGTLRKSKTHLTKEPFARMLREVEYWMTGGAQDWELESPSFSPQQQQQQKHKKSVLHRHSLGSSLDSQLEDQELSQSSQLASARFCHHITETPSYIRGRLRDYQIEGVNWILGLNAKCVNGILADEMGLGKTFQTIAALAVLKYSHGLPGPHLVVCPKSVMGNWYREFRQWCPTLSVFKFHAPGSIRRLMVKAHLHPHNNIRYDVVVTTFEMILEEIHTFKKIAWRYLIVDEAHKLKNEESRAHVALDSLKTCWRLLITGTPLQNNLKELWALLHFLSPELFRDGGAFEEWFNSSKGTENAEAIKKMHMVLAPLMLRRLKQDVNTGIPPKKEIYVSCSLSRRQREWYSTVLAKDAELLNKASGGAVSRLNNIIMHLRKVVNHPYLMVGGEDGPPFKTDEWLVRHSGKMVVLDMLLRKLRQDTAGEHKVLIFSQFTTMLNILEDYCTMVGYPYCRIDGNTSALDRERQMAEFNAPGSEQFIFLLSTRSGGLGINLQAANHVILYDSDWNPQMDLQAQDRAHRIGQKRSVRIYRFIVDGTMEERIYKRALKKLYLDAMVVQQGRVQGKAKQQQQTSTEELLSMIRFGAEEIFKSRGEDVTEADIDRLLEEGEAKHEQMTGETKQVCQMSLASFKLGADEQNLYEFEGVSYDRADATESKTIHVKFGGSAAVAGGSAAAAAVVADGLPRSSTTAAAEEAGDNRGGGGPDSHNKGSVVDNGSDGGIVSADLLEQRCAAFGEVTKVVLHPNLQEALVHYRTVLGAADAKKSLALQYGWTCHFATKENIQIVTRQMIDECFNTGVEKLGRGQRVREPVKFYSDEDVAKLQQKREKAPPLKLPKAPVYPYWQLYNAKRLLELHNTEVALLVRNWRARHDRDETAATTTMGASPTADNAGAAQFTNVDVEDLTLSAQEQEERERLLAEGFSQWTRKEYHDVRRAVTQKKISIKDFRAISEYLGTKSEGEVRDYINALYERGSRCVPSFDAFERAITRAQLKLKEEEALRNAIKWKVERVEGQLCEENLRLAPIKHTAPRDLAALDRKLFLMAYERNLINGFGVFGSEIRAKPEHWFDIYYQTRSDDFIAQRTSTILRMVKREFDVFHAGGGGGDDGTELGPRRKKRRIGGDEADAAGGNSPQAVSPTAGGPPQDDPIAPT